MEKTKLVELFSERPYACALNSEAFHRCCSFCFTVLVSPSSLTCSACNTVKYCNESCLAEDAKMHVSECLALASKREPPENVHVWIRLRMMSRLISRRKLDNGQASLSKGFPSFAKERCLGDLISHYGRQCLRQSSRQDLDDAIDHYRRMFQDTPVGGRKRSELRRLFCLMYINAFNIESPDDGLLGKGLYLNGSRFNHSCAPTAQYSFRDNTIVFKRIARCLSYSDYAPEPVSPSEFSNLTINYGFQINKPFTLTVDRLASFKYRYFFVCKCVQCVRDPSSRLEKYAASAECRACLHPFRWRVPTDLYHPQAYENVKLKRTCRCENDEFGNRLRAEVNQNVRIRRDVITFERLFAVVERALNNETVLDDELAQAAFSLINRLCHPLRNVRYAQTASLLFNHFNQKLDDKTMLNSAVQIGERLMDAYRFHQVTNGHFQNMAIRLYLLYNKLGDGIRAEHWRNEACTIHVEEAPKTC